MTYSEVIGYSQPAKSSLRNLESEKIVYRRNGEFILIKKCLKYPVENLNEYLTGGVI